MSRKPDRAAILRRLSAICMPLPEAEANSRTGDHTAFVVRGRKFAYLLDNHHGDGRLTFCARVPRGENSRMVAAAPARYFMPPYIGAQGWVGLYMDRGRIDWGEVERLALDSYVMVAPKKLVAAL
jgi:phosphoribosylglycinamide formyltransferase-1